MENLKDNLIKKINDKIKDENIKMKPRFYFVLKGFLIISFISIIFLGALYVGNFILLIFHEHLEVFDFLRIDNFSFSRFLEFLKIIPGLLLLLLLVFVLSLYKLIKDHSFVYRKNIIYIILILFLILIFTAVNIHRFLDKDFKKVRFGERGEFPGMIYLHRYYRGDRIIPFAEGLQEKRILEKIIKD